MDYWTAVKAAIYWCKHGKGCAYVAQYTEGDHVVITGDDSPTLHRPDIRICLRVGR